MKRLLLFTGIMFIFLFNMHGQLAFLSDTSTALGNGSDDAAFHSPVNRAAYKAALRKEYGAIFGYSKTAIGSGIASEFDDKGSKISGQALINLAAGSGGRLLAFGTKISASTDGAFYKIKAQERPTIGTSGYLYLMLKPTRWNLTGRTDTSASSYTWYTLGGSYNNGQIKFANISDTAFSTFKDTSETWSFGISYNYFIRYNDKPFYRGKGHPFSFYLNSSLDFVCADNLTDLSAYTAQIQRTLVDTINHTTTYLNEDKGKHYGVSDSIRFKHNYDFVLTQRLLLEPAKGLVLSIAGNCHIPTRNVADNPETTIDERRKPYYGFEGGFHFYVKNEKQEVVANFGLYGDYNFAFRKDMWLIGFKTSIPIGL